MFKILKARVHQKYRTAPYPRREPEMPDRFQGCPLRNGALCPAGCRACIEVCPTDAITGDERGWRLDLGRCLFCGECARACPRGALTFTREFRLAVRAREDLQTEGAALLPNIRALNETMRRLFGRSLKLREVSAGGCNACEADLNVLNTVVYDLGRFGIQFVASPRHADGLLISGPVTRNMELALKKTWDAVPEPKLVIAVGACAISGGPYRGHPQVLNGAGALLPVDLYIPGCPPHPLTILDGLLRLLGRKELTRTASRE